MSGVANHYRERAMATVAAYYDAAGGERLAAYLPAAEAEAFTKRVAELRSTPVAIGRRQCAEALEGLRVAEDLVLLCEVHPAWMIQILEKESPLVAGILLRSLPARHVRYLVEQLPPQMRERLPTLIDTFAVAPALLQLVRRTFEHHFVPMRPTPPLDRFVFPDLAVLRAEELEALLHDLGIQELALAFRDMDRRGVQIVLNRLQFADAKALKERIEGAAPDPVLERDAKYTLFDIAVATAEVQGVLQEIGVHGVAKALAPADGVLAQTLRQKLVPRLGYLLQRCFDTYAPRNHPQIAARRRALILERVAALAGRGTVDQRWGCLLATPPASGRSESAVVRESEIVPPQETVIG